MSPLHAFGARLKAARERRGLSQRALSALSGVTQAKISRVENGEVDLRFSSLASLAAAMELELTLLPAAAPADLRAAIEAAAPEPSGAARRPADKAALRKKLALALEALKAGGPIPPQTRRVRNLRAALEARGGAAAAEQALARAAAALSAAAKAPEAKQGPRRSHAIIALIEADAALSRAAVD